MTKFLACISVFSIPVLLFDCHFRYVMPASSQTFVQKSSVLCNFEKQINLLSSKMKIVMFKFLLISFWNTFFRNQRLQSKKARFTQEKISFCWFPPSDFFSHSSRCVSTSFYSTTSAITTTTSPSGYSTHLSSSNGTPSLPSAWSDSSQHGYNLTKTLFCPIVTES